MTQTQSTEQATVAVREATERVEQAQQALARLKQQAGEAHENGSESEPGDLIEGKTMGAKTDGAEAGEAEKVETLSGETESGEGETELRKDSMMAHLLDALQAKQDIGHYGRLVFAMVARHFMEHDDVLAWLTRDSDFAEADARSLLQQVEGRDYNPPKRDRILEWQTQQEFPILPHPEDPDCGNLYRNLKFPDAVYSHISQYQQEKASAE